MRVNYLVYLTILILLFSCKQEKSTVNQDIHINQINKVELLLQRVLNSEKLDPYLQLINKKTNLQLYVVKQDSFGITNALNLEKFGKRLEIIDLELVEKDSIKSYIRFEKLEIKNNKAQVRLYYEIKGLGYDATFNYDNNDWTEVYSRIWQN